jgi:hypothetical protein
VKELVLLAPSVCSSSNVYIYSVGRPSTHSFPIKANACAHKGH